MLFSVIIVCICIYIVPPEFRVHMILESRPDWLLHGCLGTLWGIGGRWAGSGRVLTDSSVARASSATGPPAPHEASGDAMAGPGPLRLLPQCSPGSSPRGRAVCLQGTLGGRLGRWLCPQALPEAPGEEGRVRPCPLKIWARPGPADTLHAEAFSAKRLPLQELSAEALDLACPLTWSDVSTKAGFWTVPAPLQRPGCGVWSQPGTTASFDPKELCSRGVHLS